jgi:hypothetical protein
MQDIHRASVSAGFCNLLCLPQKIKTEQLYSMCYLAQYLYERTIKIHFCPHIYIFYIFYMILEYDKVRIWAIFSLKFVATI